MRILDVRNNENLMHAKDKPTLEFLPGGFTARPMQQFQTSSDAITCLYRCNISYPERGGEMTLITVCSL